MIGKRKLSHYSIDIKNGDVSVKLRTPHKLLSRHFFKIAVYLIGAVIFVTTIGYRTYEYGHRRLMHDNSDEIFDLPIDKLLSEGCPICSAEPEDVRIIFDNTFGKAVDDKSIFQCQIDGKNFVIKFTDRRDPAAQKAGDDAAV